jgi:four helix bundle protein
VSQSSVFSRQSSAIRHDLAHCPLVTDGQPPQTLQDLKSTAEGKVDMSGCYRDLKVWKNSMALSLEVYRLTQRYPTQEIYGLTNQMRRAAVSIASNIAEGKGRSSDRDFALFLCHARGSLHELETQLLIARQLGHVDAETSDPLEVLIAETGKMLNGLINSLKPPNKAR